MLSEKQIKVNGSIDNINKEITFEVDENETYMEFNLIFNVDKMRVRFAKNGKGSIKYKDLQKGEKQINIEYDISGKSLINKAQEDNTKPRIELNRDGYEEAIYTIKAIKANKN